MHIVRLIQTHNWTKLRRSSAKLPWSCGATLLWRFSLSPTKPRNVAEFVTGITIYCRRRALSPVTATCPRIRPATTGPWGRVHRLEWLEDHLGRLSLFCTRHKLNKNLLQRWGADQRPTQVQNYRKFSCPCICLEFSQRNRYTPSVHGETVI